MIRLKQIVCVALFMSVTAVARANWMEETMFRSGKINVVVAVVTAVVVGLGVYLVMLDKKVSRLEKEINDKKV